MHGSAAIVLWSRSFLVLPRLNSSGGKWGPSNQRAFRLPSQHPYSQLRCQLVLTVMMRVRYQLLVQLHHPRTHLPPHQLLFAGADCSSWCTAAARYCRLMALPCPVVASWGSTYREDDASPKWTALLAPMGWRACLAELGPRQLLDHMNFLTSATITVM